MSWISLYAISDEIAILREQIAVGRRQKIKQTNDNFTSSDENE